MKKGKFIVFYGINNLGKTTQAKLLVEKFKTLGNKAKYLKYPIYDLEPSGFMINNYLRKGNPDDLSAREAQILYALNRSQYEPRLKQDLEDGFDIVAEDYWGTGIAWGAGVGLDKDFLLRLNQNFLREDLAFLFVGARFKSGFEENHLHETNKELIEKVDKIHRELAEEFGWIKINANDTIENVSNEIWNIVTETFL